MWILNRIALSHLLDGFGFEPSTSRIRVVDSVGKHKVTPDWAAGSMLYEVRKTREENRGGRMRRR